MERTDMKRQLVHIRARQIRRRALWRSGTWVGCTKTVWESFRCAPNDVTIRLCPVIDLAT